MPKENLTDCKAREVQFAVRGRQKEIPEKPPSAGVEAITPNGFSEHKRDRDGETRAFLC